MKKNYISILSAFIILGILYWLFYSMMPQSIQKNEALSQFSTKRALEIVKIISEKPHFVGSENHNEVASYLVQELKKMGLETSFQEGFTLTEKGTLVKSKNILARIKGTSTALGMTDKNKALLLLSHYDSAPHSYSHGASDDGSGVATILEGVRAFLENKTAHKNDVIILFSDAEELGLNGAALFVTQHKWAKEVGLVLNFEARGSSGPSYMLMETNGGNAALVNGFTTANPKFPVSNSLMYSIYKMLPNDTDLTVFRESANIQGFNFAFIDNHFNYHTAQDDFAHLNPTTLAHQGTYLMPLLNYFSNADLKNIHTKNDYVYFNTPFYFVSYPFDWILPMWIGALILFLALVFIGIAKRTLSIPEIAKGFIPMFISVILVGLITFFGWKGLLVLYPQYNDILQGFTYNGHDYIVAFTLLSLAICFMVYQKYSNKKTTLSHYIAPLFLWLIINFAIAFKLPGAGFLILSVFGGLLMLAYYVITQKSNWILNLILSLPALIILTPFIQMFPIGLGLKILFGSAVLTVLSFSLLLPVFGSFTKKGSWAFIFFVLSICFFVKAHINSGYENGKAKPNSLLYVLDADTNKAVWTTYDKNLDEWTKGYLGDKPKDAKSLNENNLYSKYGSEFTFMAEAPLKNIPKPTIEFLRDSIVGNNRYLKILITPNRKVNRYDIFANEKLVIQNLKANGVKSLNLKSNIINTKSNKILSYYVVDNIPLELEFSINAASVLDMRLMESSFDLLNNPMFTIPKRKNAMMPLPFVLNDAVVIKEKIKQNIGIQTPIVKKPLPAHFQNTLVKDTLKTQ